MTATVLYTFLFNWLWLMPFQVLHRRQDSFFNEIIASVETLRTWNQWYPFDASLEKHRGKTFEHQFIFTPKLLALKFEPGIFCDL